MASIENNVRLPVLPKNIELLSTVKLVVHDENRHQVTLVPGGNSLLKSLVTPRQTANGGTHGNLTRAVKNNFIYLK